MKSARREASTPAGIFSGSTATKKLAIAKLDDSALAPEFLNALKYRLCNDASQIDPKFLALPCIYIAYLDPVTGTPYLCPDGIREFFQIRYLGDVDALRIANFGAEVRRYDQQSDSGTHAYFPPTVNWKKQKVQCITEGAFKAASACAHGVPTIALQGVSSYLKDGELLPELKAAPWAEEVTLVFDNDPFSKPNARQTVAKELNRLRGMLESMGVKTRTKVLPSDGSVKVGIDDFIKALAEKAGSNRAAEEYLKWFIDSSGEEEVGMVFGRKHPIDRYMWVCPLDSFINLETMNYLTTRALDRRVDAVVIDATTNPPRTKSASEVISEQRPIDSLVWHPDFPRVTRGKVVNSGGEWMDSPDSNTLNLYQPPTLKSGDKNKAKPWIDLVKATFPETYEHIIDYFAFKAQHPGTKIQHGLVLGGSTGIGKDSILVPVQLTVGMHNWANISPTQCVSNWNGYLKNVIVQIDEAGDTGADEHGGTIIRKKFEDATKTLLASPPIQLQIDEKYIKQQKVFNVCGCVITTNHKFGALHLSPNDRRHHVSWSPIDMPREEELQKKHPHYKFIRRFWEFMKLEKGASHVAAFLREVDIKHFDPDQEPAKTNTWREMVNYDRPATDIDLDDLIKTIGRPHALITSMLWNHPGLDLTPYTGPHGLQEQMSKTKLVPKLMDAVGYVRCSNPHDLSGRWRVMGRQESVYVQKDHPDRFKAVEDLIKQRKEAK